MTADTDTQPADPGQIMDQLCDQLEDGWRAGQPPDIADLVTLVAEPLRPGLLRQLLPIEMEYRAKAGRPLTPGEAQQRYGGLNPWAWDVIQDLLAANMMGFTSEHTPSNGPSAAALGETVEQFPKDIGKFRVLRKLGGGGMGIVYLAWDSVGHREVAVKVMRPEYAANPVARERFLREARAAMTIEHDHVVPVYQVEENDGSPFLVMPVLKGESLEERLARDPLPPLDLVRKVGIEVALGLAAAHDKGIVHRDVKPGNTWLEGNPASADPAEQVRRVKVLDFGLARALEPIEGGSVAGMIVGTPAYMSPEQARGERVDCRADLFSLGAVLYRMTAGRPAFTGPTITAVLTQIATHQPPPPTRFNAAIPASLSTLVMRMLEKDAEKRHASAREVVEALAEIKPEPMPRPPKRWLLAGSVLLALCLVAVGAKSLFSGAQPASEAPPHTSSTGPLPAPSPTPIAAPPQPESLRVKSLDVNHFAKTVGGDEFRGALGKKSYSPALGDRLQVVAKLSRPASAYIIAFRPDGVAELCYPNNEDTAPPLTDTPRYPEAGSVKAYGLREGTGLWVFAVVASDKPLPTYRQWLANRNVNWKREAAPLGTVWWYDGALLETLFDASRTRAKDEELAGPQAAVRSLGQWLGQAPDTAIGVLGFSVGTSN